MEGRSGSMEGRRTEGISSLVTDTLADEQARFASASEQFRRSRPESGIRPGRPDRTEPLQVMDPEPNPLAQVLASKEGLAQAILVAEVLGKPRAFRPYRKR